MIFSTQILKKLLFSKINWSECSEMCKNVALKITLLKIYDI